MQHDLAYLNSGSDFDRDQADNRAIAEMSREGAMGYLSALGLVGNKYLRNLGLDFGRN